MHRIINLGLLIEEPKRVKPRYCGADGCIESTSHGKEFCSVHVLEHSYVKKLLQEMGERDRVDEAVARQGIKAASLNAITAQELIQYLEFNGPRTVEHLVRFLDVEEKVLKGYIRLMVKAGLVKVGTTKRGSSLVKKVAS